MPVILLFCFLLIGVISPYTTVFAQELHFRNFTTKDGLPSVQVYNMYQDVNGFMWFATDRGICRYNGYNFETFGLKDGLTSNTVFKFYPQDNGDVWCSTLNNRFIIFNPTDYVFREYQYNDTLASYAADAINDDLFIDRCYLNWFERYTNRQSMAKMSSSFMKALILRLFNTPLLLLC